MPQFFSIEKDDYQIVVWKYDNYNQLSEENIFNISVPIEYHHEKRKAEYLSTRVALASISPEENVTYLPTGKPIVEHDYISFSHTSNYSAVIKSKYPSGIDIEHKRDKIKRIQHKFLHPEEAWAIDNIEKLHVIWGAKESIYKTYDIEGLTYKQDLIIDPFDLDSEFHFTVRFLYKGKNVTHKMKCIIFEDLFLIYNLS